MKTFLQRLALVCLLFGSAVFLARTSQSTRAADNAYVPLPKGSVTWSKQIAPIVFNNCSNCHRPGEVAPFPLMNYADAKKRARQIAIVTQSRFMPPWKVDEGKEKFQDAHRLTDTEIGMIGQWAEDGAPEGDAAQAPKAPAFTSDWHNGKPDLVLQPEAPYELAAEGDDVYRCFVIPTNYDEDRYVSAMEVRPGNRAVVHHVIAYLDTTGQAREKDMADAGPGYTSFGGIGILPSGSLGGWAPGLVPRKTPAGSGILLPKGADIVLQVHYHKSGKPEVDQTKIGLFFADGPIDKQVRMMLVVNPGIRIPAGEANHIERASTTVPIDITALATTPHMHLLGKEMELTATLPDDTKKKLVRVDDWDFNWQMTYVFNEPIKLPKGSKIDLMARYDNSAQNPTNPSDPPRAVRWGEQTTDEMCIAFIPYTVDEEHLLEGKTAPRLPFTFGGGGRRREALQQLRQRLDEKNTVQ